MDTMEQDVDDDASTSTFQVMQKIDQTQAIKTFEKSVLKLL